MPTIKKERAFCLDSQDLLSSDPRTSKQNERALNEIVEEEKSFLQPLVQGDNDAHRKLVIISAKRSPELLEDSQSRPEPLEPNAERYQHHFNDEQPQR